MKINAIKSLLDTDLYTFTQQQLIFHKYSKEKVKYAFKWRNMVDMVFKISLEEFKEVLDMLLDAFCKLKFTEEELNYLRSLPYMSGDYVEFLRGFQPNRNYIKTYIDKDELKVDIEGPWLYTIIFEVPVLAMISEIYTHQLANYAEHYEEACKRIEQKWDRLIKFTSFGDMKEHFNFVEFGTRRRASFEIQSFLLSIMKGFDGKSKYLSGTSNVYYAKELNLTPAGTMSHQYLEAFQQIVGVANSQKVALQEWLDEYKGNLGIALTDCMTFDAFLVDFDKNLANAYTGCRHDSGDPFNWADKLLRHYQRLNIDPKTKTLVFSDGLDMDLVYQLFRRYYQFINVTFGIGTHLTNDCGFIAPQIVIKLIEVNGEPVAKVPDSPGKQMCLDENYLRYIFDVIRRKVENAK